MTVYLTEEEQVEAIKSFFKKNARHLAAGILVLLAIFGGWRYWTWHNLHIQTESSALYESLMKAVSDDDHVKIHAYAARLIQLNRHATYADFARLMLAKCDMNEAKGEQAKKLLSVVAEKASLKELRQVARLRLARILLNENKSKEALSVLNQVDDGNYQLLALALRGDAYIAQHDDKQAKAAYEQAKVLSKRLGIVNPLLDLKYAALEKKQGQA
ncbi:MAG: tetratricopeptide repeat protein [Gammaproteobacteria bacterium]|nr:tetratricopeptide repeat protein [Gammaproteobacteria bacterium]